MSATSEGPMPSEQTGKLRALARQVLTSGEVTLVIGFADAATPGRAAPLFCTMPEQTDRLTFNGFCTLNLANYLVRPEFAQHKAIALVAKHADAKAAVGLIQESQVEATRVRLIPIDCGELDGATPDVPWTVGERLLTVDEYLATAAGRRDGELNQEAPAEVCELDARSDAERWEYWSKEFDRCIRCYACRNVCPLCYCQRCIAEKNQPQWIDSSATLRGNFAWNIVRAFHLAGRCIECGACERACPMDLPLMKLNRKLRQVVAKQFGYVAGYDPKAEPPLADFRKDDPEEFIK
jgi:ferredoxin